MNKVSDIQLADNSVISLHAQLHNQLRHLILSGRWASGTRIPSENQLTNHLKISRSTIRLALQQAEIEGLIARVAGRGTFVAYTASQERGRRLIAFVVSDLDTENNLFMLNGAESKARASGYQIIFSHGQSQQEEIEILTGLSEEENIAGVLLWPNATEPQNRAKIAASYAGFVFPIVTMDRQVEGYDCDFVTSDNYGGAYALMQHLVELGHTQIAFLSHHQIGLQPVAERYRAYCDVLTEAGLIPHDPWIIGQPGNEISVTKALRSSVDNKSPELQQIKDHVLKAETRPTAIFGVNDYIAILAMRAIKLLELPVPEEISIAGFDDSYLAAHLEVPLTTVAQDSFLIGKHAAELLIDRLEGYVGPSRCEIIPVQLRLRSSTSMVECV
jgi:DNA-binding LacI/PurR family transcriptional regulator